MVDKRELIKFKLTKFNVVNELYKKSFPIEERYSLLFLLFLNLRGCANFKLLYDENELCGVIYYFNYQQMIFILYLAIDDKYKSMGYGSFILNEMFSEYPSHEFILNIEPIGSYDNIGERIKRKHFYQKNGFEDTGYVIIDSDVSYDIFSTSECFSIYDYKKLINRIFLFDFKTRLIRKE